MRRIRSNGLLSLVGLGEPQEQAEPSLVIVLVGCAARDGSAAGTDGTVAKTHPDIVRGMRRAARPGRRIGQRALDRVAADLVRTRRGGGWRRGRRGGNHPLTSARRSSRRDHTFFCVDIWIF